MLTYIYIILSFSHAVVCTVCIVVAFLTLCNVLPRALHSVLL